RASGETIAADALIDGLDPERIKRLAPSVELGDALSARVHAVGSVKRVGIAAELAIGSAQIDARGTFATDPAIDLTLALAASRLDARAFATTAPPFSTDAQATLWL